MHLWQADSAKPSRAVITVNIILSDGTPLTLPDGTVPTNWGQFKKALLDKQNNLGVIVSGQADPLNSSTDVTQQHGNGKDKENKGKGRGRNNNHP